MFNPSNLGLVVCFLLLGAQRVDPLDFWWGPLAPGLVARARPDRRGRASHLRRLQLLQSPSLLADVRRGLGVIAAAGTASPPAGTSGRSTTRVLVAARLLARDPRVPVLHDHRSEDTPRGPMARRAYGDRSRAPCGAAGRAADHRVRDQGRHPRRAGARVCDERAREAAGAPRLAHGCAGGASASPRPAAAGAALVGVLAFEASACSQPGFRRDRTRSEATTAGGPLPEIVVVGLEGRRSDRGPGGPGDRAGRRRGSPPRVGCLAAKGILRMAPRRARAGAWLASLWADKDHLSCSGDHRRLLRRRSDGADAAARRVPGSAWRRRQPPGNVRRVDVRSDARCARGRRDPRALPANRGAPAKRGDVPDLRSEEASRSGRRSAGPASGTLGGTTFVDVARESGLDFRQGGSRYGSRWTRRR